MNPFELPIDTDRMLLRPYRDDDLADLAGLLAIPEVMQYLFEEPMTREDLAKVLRTRIPLQSIQKDGDRLALAATLRSRETLIGTVNLTLRSLEHRQGEIGYVFHPDHQGKGYATEAANAMLKIGFEQADMHRIYGRCDVRNGASARLMERLGMRQEAHLVENEWFKGEWGSEFVYAMLKGEWCTQFRRL